MERYEEEKVKELILATRYNNVVEMRRLMDEGVSPLTMVEVAYTECNSDKVTLNNTYAVFTALKNFHKSGYIECIDSTKEVVRFFHKENKCITTSGIWHLYSNENTPNQFIKLVSEVRSEYFEEQQRKKEAKMENNVLNKVKDQAMESVKHGVQVGASKKAASMLVDMAKKLLGENYPAFFSTPMGSRVEPYLVCLAASFLGNSLAEKSDAMKKVSGVANLAMEGFVASDFEDMLKMLDPIVAQLNLVDTVSK